MKKEIFMKNMVMRRTFILCALVFVSLGSIQAMRKKRVLAAEKTIKNALRLYNAKQMSLEMLKKRVGPIMKQYPNLADKYKLKEVLGQLPPGPQRQQERLRQEQERLTRLEREKQKRQRERLEKERKKEEKPKPTTPERPPPGLEGSLRDILDIEFFKYMASKEDYFKQIQQKDLVNTFQTIEQYRILTKDKTAYGDFYKDIRSGLGVNKLEDELSKIKDYYIIGMEDQKLLAGIRGNIDEYRYLTDNLLAYDGIYQTTLKRIDELQHPKRPKKKKKEKIEGNLLQFPGQEGNVQQVTVYRQGGPGGGGAASCGYHSLKNSIFIIRSILGNTEEELGQVGNPEIIKKYIGQGGIWRTIIIEKNHKKAERFARTSGEKLRQEEIYRLVVDAIDGGQFLQAYNLYTRIRGGEPLDVGGEWLKEDDIDLLAKYEKTEGLLKDFPGIEYTVIENIPMMQTELRGFSSYGTVAEIAQKLRDNDNYIHGFSLGLMGHYGGGASHWISLVVNKVEGDIQFIFADSLGGDRINHGIVRIMIEELLKKSEEEQ